jgi:hypothetical protein
VRIDLDPRLVEEAVYLLARADEARWLELRRRIDPLYDSKDRERHMEAAHRDFFRAWGAEAVIEEALRPVEGPQRALVARSIRPDDEGADLLVGEERTLLLRLVATRFLDLPALGRGLRHELRHVTDMLDPAFGYRPDLGASGRTRAELDLVRDRYRSLWDRAIEAVEPSPLPPEVARARFDRAFGALSPGLRETLHSRFADPALRTHATLVAASRDPWAFLGAKRASGPAPGSPCPLCGFPSWSWDPAPPAGAIRADIYRVAVAPSP